MNQNVDFFKTFCKVSNALGTAKGKEQVIDLIVHSAVETMDGKAACLFLADEEHDVFIPVVQTGLSENYFHAGPLHAKKVTELILKEGYLAVHDATTDPRLENHEAKKAEGIASILDVPVMVGDKFIGVLALYTSSPRDFQQDDIEFLTALAEQGGIAIERATLFERLKKNSELFVKLSSTINSSLDIKKIFNILTEDIANALGMKGVIVRLKNEDTGSVDLVASHGLSEAFLNKGPMEPDKNIQRALKGETVVVRDVATDDSVFYKKETLNEGIVALLFVPMKSKDKIIGLIVLCSAVHQEFPEDTIKLIDALAHQGGLAIRNASMYLMIQQDKKDLEDEIWSHKSWF